MNFKVNESDIKLRGGYYTAPDIATFLLRWVLEKNPHSLLEPSCGDGVFFRCLSVLNHDSLDTALGFEINEGEAIKSRFSAKAIKKVKTEIFNKDFIEWYLKLPMIVPMFDAIVGNPPFIRYQYLEDQEQIRYESVFKQFGLDFTKHTNAWVPFVICSIALLRSGGRIAMVLPSELLHVLHAESLRAFLAEQCSRICIIDPQEIWFEDTLQGAILLLAEKKSKDTSASKGVSIIPTKSKRFLADDPSRICNSSEYVNGEVLSGKWMRALLSESERVILKDVLANKGVYKFGEIADVAVGIVTGANKFFLVPDNIVTQYHLEKWSYPMFGRSDHVPGVIFDKKVYLNNRKNGIPTNFLWFKSDKFEDLPESVKEYIKLGEKEKIHERYKCRIRSPWYSVPSVYATEIGMLKRSHDFPRLIMNKMEAFTTDTAYRINSKAPSNSSLVFSFINSLTMLTAELEGRHYGGGVLELVPSEIRKLAVPLAKANISDVEDLNKRVIRMEVPEELLSVQDHKVLQKIGIGEEKAGILRSAWKKLRDRRQRNDINLNQ